jgi:hypothetical protein
MKILEIGVFPKKITLVTFYEGGDPRLVATEVATAT